MPSQKQIDANRLNAQKSTGPVSAEGKSKSRLNAVRDGLTGQVVTLSEEDRPVFEKLKAELIADLAPQSVMELRLANSIAWDTWRLDRIRAVEMNMYALGANDPDCDIDCDVDCGNPELRAAMSAALTFRKECPAFALLSLYEQRMNRGIHKNLAALRQLQAERKRSREEDLREETAIAQANEANGLQYRAPATPSRNGFIFSTGEVLMAADRETVIRAVKSAFKGPNKARFAKACQGPEPNRPNSGLHAAAAA